MRGWRRAPERRRTMGTLLKAVVTSLPAMRDLRQLRSTFEEELRSMLDARRIELRDGRATRTPIDASISVQVALVATICRRGVSVALLPRAASTANA